MHFFTAILAIAGPAKECPAIPIVGTACNVVVGGADAVGSAASSVSSAFDLAGAIGTIVKEFLKFFTDFAGFMKDFILWFIQLFFPSELQTWFFGTVGMEPLHAGHILSLDASNPNDPYHNLYTAMISPGLAVAAGASGARILRTLLDQRSTSMNVIVDVLVRFFVVLVVLVPIGGVSLGYLVIAWSYDAVQAFSVDIAGHLLSAALFKGAPVGSSTLEKIFFAFTNLPSVGATFFVGFLFWILFLLYALVMLIVRAILIGFCVAMAPLCIATAAFDTRNKFFAWWLDIFTGSLAIAPILTIAFWVSFTLAASVIAGIPPVGAIIAIIIMIGSIWMAGKLIHQLTWKHFSHGGAIGAFGAAFGVLALAGKAGQVGGLTKLGDHPTWGPVMKTLAALGYAGSGFYPESRGGHGPIIPDQAAHAALSGDNAGKHGGISTDSGRTNSAGGRVATPAAAAGLQSEDPEGDNYISSESEGQLATGVSDLINSGEFSRVVGDQLSSDPGVNNQDVVNASPQGRAQMYWDSLSKSKQGVEAQVHLARQAYSHLLGSGGLSTSGGGGGGGGGTGGGGSTGGGGGGTGGGGGGGSTGGGGGGGTGGPSGGGGAREAEHAAAPGLGFGGASVEQPGFFGEEYNSQ